MFKMLHVCKMHIKKPSEVVKRQAAGSSTACVCCTPTDCWNSFSKGWSFVSEDAFQKGCSPCSRLLLLWCWFGFFFFMSTKISPSWS